MASGDPGYEHPGFWPTQCYMEDCLQSLLPGSLELVHFPFNLRSLFMPTMEMKAMAAMALGIWALCLLVCCLTAMPGTGTHLMRSIWIPAGLVVSLQSVFPLLPLSPSFHLLPII